MFEERWVNTESMPDILQADLEGINANEWLIENAPFTRGDIMFAAEGATTADAINLGIVQGQAIFIVKRSTWNEERSITHVRLAYAPGFEMQTQI